MTIVVLNTDPAIRIPVQRMLDQAHRHDPNLARTGTDLAILASIGPTGPLAPAPGGAALVVVTDRPSPAQAAAALLLGARAYLPLDLPPDRTADALRHAAQGCLHLEPETAAILRAGEAGRIHGQDRDPPGRSSRQAEPRRREAKRP